MAKAVKYSHTNLPELTVTSSHYFYGQTGITKLKYIKYSKSSHLRSFSR